MTVFCVFKSVTYSGDELIALFTTEQKADKYIEDFCTFGYKYYVQERNVE